MFDIGRVCLKTAGREAGKYCVVVKKPEGGFATVTGPQALTKVKRRRCNVEHLEPLPHVLKISADASEADVLNAFDEELLNKLGLRKPTVAEIREAEEMAKRRAEMPKPKEAKPAEQKKKAKEAKKAEKTKEAKAEKPKEKPKETGASAAEKKEEKK